MKRCIMNTKLKFTLTGERAVIEKLKPRQTIIVQLLEMSRFVVKEVLNSSFPAGLPGFTWIIGTNCLPCHPFVSPVGLEPTTR